MIIIAVMGSLSEDHNMTSTQNEDGWKGEKKIEYSSPSAEKQ